jgi:hypothetical protein
MQAGVLRPNPTCQRCGRLQSVLVRGRECRRSYSASRGPATVCEPALWRNTKAVIVDTTVPEIDNPMRFARAIPPSVVGAAGGNDLYVVVRKSDGSWTTPVSLGPAVNTRHIESSPTLSSDGRFLFVSRQGEVWWVATGRQRRTPQEYEDPHATQRAPVGHEWIDARSRGRRGSPGSADAVPRPERGRRRAGRPVRGPGCRAARG